MQPSHRTLLHMSTTPYNASKVDNYILDNHTSTSLLSFLQAGWPSCRPTNSVKALKAKTWPQTYCTSCPKVPVASNHFLTGSFVCLMYVCQSVTEVVYGRVVEDAWRPVILTHCHVSPSARSAAAARPAGLYGTTDNASLLTNAKVRLYNCDSAYDVSSIGV